MTKTKTIGVVRKSIQSQLLLCVIWTSP